MLKIAVIDGQGGGIGRRIIEEKMQLLIWLKMRSSNMDGQSD